MQLSLNCVSKIIFGKVENLISWSVFMKLKWILVVLKAKCHWDKEPIIKN